MVFKTHSNQIAKKARTLVTELQTGSTNSKQRLKSYLTLATGCFKGQGHHLLGKDGLIFTRKRLLKSKAAQEFCLPPRRHLYRIHSFHLHISPSSLMIFFDMLDVDDMLTVNAQKSIRWQ